jgi:hypothetical protein
MKSERRSFPRSAQTFQRPVLGNGDRTLVESKCPACGQIVDTVNGSCGKLLLPIALRPCHLGVITLEQTKLRPPVQLLKPLLQLTPAHFASVAMFTVWVVGSQAGQ